MKTSELTGAALDEEVAKCADLPYPHVYDEQGGIVEVSPSTNWAQGGPIIEREGMQLSMEDRAEWRATMWWDDTDGQREVLMKGPTPLIAAMRCYVASKLGDSL